MALCPGDSVESKNYNMEGIAGAKSLWQKGAERFVWLEQGVPAACSVRRLVIGERARLPCASWAELEQQRAREGLTTLHAW